MNKQIFIIFLLISGCIQTNQKMDYGNQSSGDLLSENTINSGLLNLPSYQINEIKKLDIGNYSTQGFVVKKYACPPCPPGAMCEPCMRDNIIISEKNTLKQGYDLTEIDLVVFTDKTEFFELGKKYIFFIQILENNPKNEPINNVKLLGYKNF